ncbi:hypothetical protein BGX34_008537 [Mortierella sp. NVP85]|nr:hypothetical protein BGX34_008537 [Mortierella sp. NVP85]
MARLLRVSKTFCAATLPFLYGDCLDTCIRKHHADPAKDTIITTTQMIRTLLRQVHPQNRIPGLLRIVYLSQDGQDDLGLMEEQPPSPPIFKYGRFIRRIVPQWNNWGYAFNFVHINSLVMEYAITHQLFDQYVAEGVLSNNIDDDSKDKALEHALRMDIHRQLIWMLCQDHMEMIEELAIPLLDIEQYIDHVGQFTTLSKVTFSHDNDTSPWGYMQATHREEDGDPAQKVATAMHNRYSRGMLQFVQQHTSMHKNVLQHVEAKMYTTPDLFFEIQALLPPLHNPQSIDSSNWIRFVGRMKDTNLNHVESITLHMKSEAYHEGWGWQQEKAYEIFRSQPFLSRCRALKKLKMDTLGSDMFQWAVQEKKQMDDACQQERIASQHLSTRQHGYHALIPLQSVTIGTKEWKQPPVQELDDIAFAFSDTLEEINMQVCVNHFHLYFDMNGLGRCRALESIRLYDETTSYNHREVRSWSPVTLPQLKYLTLQGSPALHFNMDSLHHSPCLETLSLGMGSIENCYYIPSAEELERDDPDNQETDGNDVFGMSSSDQGVDSIGRRPRYTWDWHLPNLSSVSLTAVFAFKFDFQWLQHLPNLQAIRLDMKSSRHYNPSESHERRITLKDISRRQQLHQQDGDGSEEIPSEQFIRVPKLYSMYLLGQWDFEEKVVETICSFMAPNLQYVEFGVGDAGITPLESIALVKRMPCLKSIYLGLPLTPHEIQGLGLTCDYQERVHSKYLVFYLHTYGCYEYLVQ